jgi:REP element-mobilizing transposase RayT/type I restriction-modification system DNA methylase subunit
MSLESLINDCSLKNAQSCFRKLCPGSFQRMDEALENPDSERFSGITQFGELPLDGDTLLFAYAETERDLTERSARKAQFDVAREILKDRPAIDAGIFIFRGSNGAFRLSYVTKIYKGTKAAFSHFRRYTYFVDPTAAGHHTFRKQIGGCRFDSLEAIQEAFSVEAINEAFYKELANWYFWAMKHVHFPTDDLQLDKGSTIADKQKVREHDAKNLIRLLTRMLFVWFIKQRGLVPHALFDAEAVARDYLEGFSADYLDGFASQSSESRYYKAILQNFFFAALNQERGKREFRKMGAAHRDNMCLMRYKDAFKDPQRFLETVESTTPFLNGGLFECLDFLHPTEKGPNGGARKIYEDGFSDHKDNPLTVPDFLFFAPEHKADLSETWGIPSKGNETVQGLIHILNRYNFTIVENSPIEQEVALDPELLGKVFENLLASYNPETKTTARKQTGSFYTPRPIVDYMVDESLKAYLEREVQASSLNPSKTSKQDACTTFFTPSATIEITQRNLPHWNQQGVMYFVTFRLADSLPKAKLEQLQQERETWLAHHSEPFTEAESAEYHRLFSDRVEQWLDAGAGSCCLADPKLAKIVGDALRHFDGQRYQLDEWVVMPNHVHVLLTPVGDHKLEDILHSWKSFTATAINKQRNQSGQFWQHESYDHIVRSEAQLAHYRQYIQDNPIKANVKVTQASSLNPASPKRVVQASSLNPAQPSKHDACTTLRSKLDNLFSYTEAPPEFSDCEIDVLIRAIDSCKILDPACGSGAFPMGILQKLVFVLGKLDPKNERWEKRQIDEARKIEDANERRERIREIMDDFEANDDDYGRKLYLIENCLYGVDIQSIATQVSKLRFFISLVVDQNIDREKENFGVRPLPNLETKFVAADTLIAAEKPTLQAELFELTDIKQLQYELKEIRHKIFSVKTTASKQKHKKADKAKREQIAAALKGNGWPNETADRLAKWDPYKQNDSADFFDPEWMFGLKGFDVVIGNPPYVQIQKFPKPQKDKWIAQNFQTYSATADIYCLFYERGAQLLRNGGHLAYITSNKWMRAGYGDKLRDFFVKHTRPKQIIDFGGIIVFNSATVDSVIVLTAKSETASTCRSAVLSLDYRFTESLDSFIQKKTVEFTLPTTGAASWVILPPERHAIKQQVEAQGIPLKDWDIAIYRGVLTGFNDAFYLTQEQRDAFVAADPRCAEFLVRLLRGRYISRYATNWDGTWMIATFPVLNLKFEDIPSPIQNHLQQFKKQLQPKPSNWSGGKWDGRKAGAYEWFETQDVIGYHKEFSKPKIIYPNMTKYLPFYYDRNDGFYGNQKCFIITSDSNTLGYLTAFFNSSLFKCCFRDNFPNLGEDRRELSKIFVVILPVRKPTPTESALLEKLVPLVQFAKSSSSILLESSSSSHTSKDACATLLESLIDACVMECYFREHMAERDLLFHDAIASILSDYDPEADTDKQTSYLESLHARLQATDLPQKLESIPEKSPDLLGVILKEGKV